MKCSVYRSTKKSDTYVYVPKDNDIAELPEGLTKILGKIEHVLEVDLATRSSLANADIDQVVQSLNSQGYFIQLPKEEYKPE